MDLAILLLMYFLALMGIQSESFILILVAAAVVFVSAREFTHYFITGIAVAYGLRYVIPEIQTWAAISLAVAVMTIIAYGKPWKKEEEEIPPEMIPYLLEMYGRR